MAAGVFVLAQPVMTALMTPVTNATQATKLDPGGDANDAARMGRAARHSTPHVVLVVARALSSVILPITVAGMVAGMLAGATACGKDHTIPDRPERTTTPARAKAIDGAPILALQNIDAPGFNVDDLTARLRDAVAHTSGVTVVDEVSVRREIAACVEMPCKDTEQERFKQATLVANGTLSKVGTTLIGSVRVQAGLKELVRVNAQGSDAGAVVQQLGFEAGQKLHDVLTPESPAPQSAPSEER